MQSSVVLLELGTVIFGLGALGRLAGKFKLSPIPLYLLAGLMFGQGGIYPLVTSADFLSVGAEIGVILLLLLLGLEYSASDLVANLRTHARSGAADAVLNGTPGAVAAWLLGWPVPAMVAMAGITWVSSSGIAAKLLGDLGRIGNRETPVVLSVLVFEDLSMAVYLPILTALLAGAGLDSAGLSALIAVAVLMFVLAAAHRFGRAINRLVFSANDEALLLVVFGLALLVAGAAARLGVSAGVGAFLVGIALSDRVAESARAALSPLRDLFAAMFFVFFGLRTDPAVIPPELGAAVVLAVVTTLTKAAVGWWAARHAGIARMGRIRAGSVIIARGEFSVVIAGLAGTATTLSTPVAEDLTGLAAAYILIMAIAGPLTALVAEPAAHALTTRQRHPGRNLLSRLSRLLLRRRIRANEQEPKDRPNRPRTNRPQGRP